MMKEIVKQLFDSAGFQIARKKAPRNVDSGFMEHYEFCKPYTMTSMERMHGLYQAVRFLVANKVPGTFVECGVWRGGSCMLLARTLLRLGVTDRKIVLYDTFAGMSEPTGRDRTATGDDARDGWDRQGSDWCFAGLEEVKRNMALTGYPQDKLSYVQGKVEDTLPHAPKEPIALLRLDTDWYESTLVEMELLYPQLSKNGVLILDDYGHWEGSKEAVDEYFAKTGEHPLLQRVDHSGRISIKI